MEKLAIKEVKKVEKIAQQKVKSLKAKVDVLEEKVKQSAPIKDKTCVYMASVGKDGTGSNLVMTVVA